jgi:hypothetical protein
MSLPGDTVLVQLLPADDAREGHSHLPILAHTPDGHLTILTVDPYRKLILRNPILRGAPLKCVDHLSLSTADTIVVQCRQTS